jgi:Protein of unknown function (DUF3168)
MSDRSTALYTAIASALTGDATLATLLGGSGRIFNGVKDGTLPPYIDLGDDTANDYGSIGFDDAQEHTLTLHVWTEQPVAGQSAKAACIAIGARVRDLLHNVSLVLSAGFLCNLRCEFSQTLRDPDGVSWHRVLRFRAVTNS